MQKHMSHKSLPFREKWFSGCRVEAVACDSRSLPINHSFLFHLNRLTPRLTHTGAIYSIWTHILLDSECFLRISFIVTIRFIRLPHSVIMNCVMVLQELLLRRNYGSVLRPSTQQHQFSPWTWGRGSIPDTKRTARLVSLGGKDQALG